jgi:exodeoxyribonuclease VII small subunit
METTFEESLTRLEGLIKDLDNEETGLHEALTNYEEAVKILKHCYKILSTAERKIEILRTKDGENKIETVNENEFKSESK